MTINEFIEQIHDKAAPAPIEQVVEFEALVGQNLPDDYRYFLIHCNGGYVGGRLWYQRTDSDGEVLEAGVDHIGGFRKETYFSLHWARDCYLGRIPEELIWIHDDPFGNAVCLGLAGPYRGKMYFWDHEFEPDEDWDGAVETAGNLTLLCNSFTEYVGGLGELDDENDGDE